MSCARNMEWTNKMALNLIDEYEKFSILWNVKHQFHFCRKKRNEAWKEIANSLKLELIQVKQKMNSLLGSFRREKSKGKKIIETEKGCKEVYVSKWFAFERMHYLLDKYELQATVDTEKKNNDEQPSDNKQIVPDIDTAENTAIKIDETDNNESIEQNKYLVPLVLPKRFKRAYDKEDDTRLEEIFKILKESVTKEEPDHCDIYAKHIANKLRRYNIPTLAKVQRIINNTLFKADMGKYGNPYTPYPVSAFNSPQC